MTAPDPADVERIFAEVASLEPAAQSARLDELCAGDEELRAEVAALLEIDASDDEVRLRPRADAKTVGRTTAAAGGERSVVRLGEFELAEEIGRGGMAAVYRAWQPSLGRHVAVKVLTRGLTTTAAELERFRREPRRIARLHHPHVVQVIVDGVAGNEHWFAMELVEGSDLQRQIDLLRKRRLPNDPEPSIPAPGQQGHTTFVARTCRDVARALHAAHELKIVHRDVKPANLLLDRDLHVKIGDFGLARDESLGALTHTNEVGGTWHYMSPEQARSLSRGVDHRTDVYSLGVVLYEMLTLARPFDGETEIDVRRSIMESAPTAVRRLNGDVPRGLQNICERAMARDPDDRYRDAAALADDLQRFLDHREPLARGRGPWRRAMDWSRRHRWTAGVGAALLVVGLASWVWYELAWRVERDHLVASVEMAMAESDWEECDPLMLRGLRSDLDRLVTHFPTRALGADIEYARNRLAGALESWQSEAERIESEMLLAASRGEPLDPLAFQRESQLRQRMELVFPKSEKSDSRSARASLLDGYLLRIGFETVGDGPSAAMPVRFTARKIDHRTGMPGPVQLTVDNIPTNPVALGPGFWRLTVEAAGFHPIELTRDLRTGRDPETVRLRFRRSRTALEGMVRIPRAELFLREPDRPHIAVFNRPIDVPSFWIDEAEVSNREYRAFLEATDHPSPRYWDRLGPEHDDLPVTWIGWDDARAYAEWAGKRLPTVAEWLLAARGPGPDGRRFPQGGDAYAGNVDFPAVSLVGDDAEWLAYVERAWPVRGLDDPRVLDARTPEGLLHMLGNVAEWTESPGFELDRATGMFLFRADERMRVGGDWTSRAHGWTLATTGKLSPERSYAQYSLGFRCARSVSSIGEGD